MFHSLHTLRFSIEVWTDYDDEDEALDTEEHRETMDLYREMYMDGMLKRMLHSTKNLRILKLHMSTDLSGGGTNYVTHLRDVLPDTVWPNLIELALREMVTSEDGLVSLLIRHKSSLRRLSLSEICVEEGSCEDVFKRIGGQLTMLRQVRLRSFFSEEYDCFDVPGVGLPGTIRPRRDAIENYILKGGDWPNLDDLPALIRTSPPDYEPPGLPDDDPDPSDPGLNTESDEFDAQM